MPTIVLEQSSYYEWVLTPVADVKEGDTTVESHYPGFVLVKTQIFEPTATETYLEDTAVDRINADRAAAGLAPLSDVLIMIRHLQDGVFPYHCPPGSITRVYSNDAPALGSALHAVFANAPVTAQAPQESINE